MAASREHVLTKEAQRIILDILEDDDDYLVVAEGLDVDPAATDEEIGAVYTTVAAYKQHAYLHLREIFYGY